jgi:uncharacterized protein YcbX
MPVLEEIWIYPVKGMRGRSVSEALVEPWGLKGDRRWLVVDAAGRFVSQRETPRLATVEARPIAGGLALSCEGFGRVEVEALARDAERAQVMIWRDPVNAAVADPAAAVWLAEVLHRPDCRLVHMDRPEAARGVDPNYANPADRVSFADGFPLLLALRESLEDLNVRASAPVPMARFRPNLVVAGAPAWAEDGWTALTVGEGDTASTYRVAKPCERCIVTTTDQTTGERAQDGEPLITLGRFHRDARGRILFGQNVIPERVGLLRVGDRVEVEGGA